MKLVIETVSAKNPSKKLSTRRFALMRNVGEIRKTLDGIHNSMEQLPDIYFEQEVMGNRNSIRKDLRSADVLLRKLKSKIDDINKDLNKINKIGR